MTTLDRSEPSTTLVRPPNVFQMMLLKALNNPRLGKHIYAGTADPKAVEKRRKANKVARIQRRKNRKN